MKLNVILFLLLSCCFGVNAQFASNPFQSQDKFLEDAERIAKVGASRQMDSVWTAFADKWEGQLDAGQKDRIFNISKHLYAKRYQANPNFEHLFATIAFGMENGRLKGDKLDEYLVVVDSSVQQYKRYVVTSFLELARMFIEQEMVQSTRFNTLEVKKSEFSFGHVFSNEIALDPQKEAVADTAAKPALGEEWFGHLEEKKDSVSEDSGEDDGWGWGGGDDGGDDDGGDDGSDDGWGWGDDSGGDDSFEELIEPFVDTTSTFIETKIVSNIPPIVGPYIEFNQADLIMNSIFDTFKIEQTSGKLMSKDKVFVGKGGKFDWSNVNLPTDEVYCELEEYSFNAKSPVISGENAKLAYTSKFNGTVEGQFSYEARPKSPIHGASFPRFISYKNDVPVKDLAPDVIYRGGFALRGKNIYSTSVEQGASQIEIVKDGVLKFKASSTIPFAFSDSLVVNPKAKLVIYQKEDSIVHPAVALRYKAGQSVLNARKDKGNYKYAPFNDSYHKMEIIGDYLTWDVNTDSMTLEILNAKNKVPLVVSSMDHFDPTEFSRLRGLASFHPLMMVVGYRSFAKSNSFSSADMAEQYKKNPNTVKGTMITLAERGFIDYDTKTDIITVKRKAVLYAKANLRKYDYDNISIRSINSQGGNAGFNLETQDLTLTGVDQFLISDSLKVLVKPTGKKITIKAGRDIEFRGEMKAGKFIYRGDDFSFSYDNFLVNMPYIKEMAFLVPDTSSGEIGELSNKMVHTSGILYISQPNNKSGLKPFDKFPEFQANSGGAFFFGGQEILDGAYQGDSTIFFDVPPFVMDSINYSDPASINFAGTFHSGGIFPLFEENLKVMPDRSFGFERPTPPEGFPIYKEKLKEKATYYNTIRLDNKGIRGDGRIEYLTGQFLSDDFVFFSDSVKTTHGTSGNIEAGNYSGTSYPHVKLDEYNMRWLVNYDSMLLKSRSGQSFEIYDTQYSFDGTLALSPRNLFGDGKFESPISITQSKNFFLEETQFTSKNSDFLIKTDNPAKPAMKGERVTVFYNLKDKFADITAEREGDDVFMFPYTQYATSLGQAHWDFQEEKVYMAAIDSTGGHLSSFTSLNPKQDELEFTAKSAIYDQKDLTLNIDGVEAIRVANVLIMPDEGKVVVRENAEMDVLNNSTVIINSFTKYHTLKEGHIKIRSRKRFDGDAQYTYVNNIKDTMYINFDNFNVKTISDKHHKGDKGKELVEKFETSANAIVSESDSLKIFAGLQYKGKVRLIDFKKYLEFDGMISLDIARENNSWFAYQSDTEETHGKIFIDENTKVAGFPTRLLTGLYLGKTNRNLYGTMLEFDREKIGDIGMFTAKGFLTFNNETKDYIIAPTEKLDGSNPKGNKFTYNHDAQRVTYDGIFNLVKDNKDFLVSCSGRGAGSISGTDYSLNTMIMLGFEPNQNALELMAEDFQDKEHNDGANSIFSELKNKVAQFLEPKVYQRYVQEAETSGDQSLTKIFPNALVLSDVNLKWSEENQAFYSEGEIGLSHIFKDDINSRVKGYVEIPKIDDLSTINIYLETHSGQWYYISHVKGKILVYSSNDDFNLAVMDKKSKDKLETTDPHEVSLFLEDFNVKYLGGKEFKEEKKEEDPFKEKKDEEEEKKDGF